MKKPVLAFLLSSACALCAGQDAAEAIGESERILRAEMSLQAQKNAHAERMEALRQEAAAIEALAASLRSQSAKLKEANAARRKEAEDFFASIDSAKDFMREASALASLQAAEILRALEVDPSLKAACADVAEELKRALQSAGSAAEKIRAVLSAYAEILRRDMGIVETGGRLKIGLSAAAEKNSKTMFVENEK